jgi:hypothetical protein
VAVAASLCLASALAAQEFQIWPSADSTDAPADSSAGGGARGSAGLP